MYCNYFFYTKPPTIIINFPQIPSAVTGPPGDLGTALGTTDLNHPHQGSFKITSKCIFPLFDFHKLLSIYDRCRNKSFAQVLNRKILLYFTQ